MTQKIAQAEEVSCNLCGGNERRVVYKEQPERTLDESYVYSQGMPEALVSQLVQCKNCGLVFVSPRNNSNRIIKNYTEGLDYGYSSQKESRTKTFLKLVEYIERFHPPGRILDVGCASGFFLHVAKSKGWQTYGVEVNKKLADYARNQLGLEVFRGALNEASLAPESFDVVTLLDVIEHLPDPMSTLKEINRTLKNDGLIVINFPNIESLSSRVFGRRWWFLLEEHLFYFSPRTLGMMSEKTEFQVLAVKPHFQKLTLGYLVHLLQAYYPNISKVLKTILHSTSMENLNITYTAGQTTMVVKKSREQHHV
ncbi:MAG: class I SAM-dependent methyltransferase [Candidatus Brocadiales bacterium]